MKRELGKKIVNTYYRYFTGGNFEKFVIELTGCMNSLRISNFKATGSFLIYHGFSLSFQVKFYETYRTDVI